MTWKFFIDHQPWAARAAVVIRHETSSGIVSFVKPLTLEAHERLTIIEPVKVDALLGLDGKAFMQAALDDAWEYGLRPKGFADHTNEIKAMRDHLGDMRHLAFKGKPP